MVCSAAVFLGAINSMRLRYAGLGKHTGEKKNADSVSVVKHDDKSPLGRSTPSCEDNIKIDFQPIGWEAVKWIDLSRKRHKRKTFVNMAIKLLVL